MAVTEFGPIGPAFEQVIRPNILPSRVFYRVRRSGTSGFQLTLNKGILFMNKLNHRLHGIASKAFVLFLVGITSASAALPAGVSDALDNAATDGATVGGLVLVVIIGIAAFKLMRRAV